MAVLSLKGTPREALQAIIVAENPGLAKFPIDQFVLGRPKVQHEDRTSLQVIGNSGTANQQLMSGNLQVFYNRVDILRLLRNLKPLPVFGSTSVHGVLPTMAKYWGIEIDPLFVEDTPIDPAKDFFMLKFIDDQYVVRQSTVAVDMVWSDTVDIASLWRSTALNGLSLPWPYPKALNALWATTELSGLATPDLVFNMPEHSKRWEATDAVDAAWLAARTVDGPYAPADLVRVVLAACKQSMPWVCVENENTPWNLWASSIVYNDPATGDLAKAYSSMIKIRPNSVYFHEGVGDISIYYTAE